MDNSTLADMGICRKSLDILDSSISFIESGSGSPVIFLHGNPTSSFLWRNIIPIVRDTAWCLAPDLVGMGRSGRSSGEHHGFHDHFKYLNEWFNQMAFEDQVTLVLHDWGSALGFHWAYKNPDKVKAIVYMEAIVQPRVWSDFPVGRDKIFRMLKSEAGEDLAYEQNFFVETVLPKSIIRQLTPEEMNVYRLPFINRVSRKTTLDLARDLPIEGEPADIAAIVDQYGQWLASSAIPKLLIVAEPGALLHGRNLDFARTWRNQKEVTVKGIHYLQEDSPTEIGEAIKDFHSSLH
jgi:haloalkane dehalogenase